LENKMSERRPLIAGNWKMYKTSNEAAATASELAELVDDADHADIMVAPTFTGLDAVSLALTNSHVSLGAQNLHWEKEGAFTGEISAGMLTASGVIYVIIGHSERRQYFGETDETVNKKMRAAIEAGLRPVMCVGETESERDAGQTLPVLDKQVRGGLKGLVSEELTRLVIAYEPVWAIGTGKTATTEQAQEVHAYIRKLLAEMYTRDLADATRILYGGSVKPANIAELMAMEDIDGALVGGASLTADAFSQIVKF
jgi:triosephosphate isomerase